jgi:hypothetical protein
MHVYRCVAWQQTSYISVFLLGADRKETSFSIVEVCLPSQSTLHYIMDTGSNLHGDKAVEA